MNIDPYKRELLYRKAHGNSLRERYKQKLKFFLGIDPEERHFLSLTETDSIINKLVKKKKYLWKMLDFPFWMNA